MYLIMPPQPRLTKKYVRVPCSQKRHESTGIRTPVCNPRYIGRFHVIGDTRKNYVLRKVSRIGQSLLRGQEPETLCRQIRCWHARAIEAVLKDDSDPVGGLSKFGHDALLQVGQPVYAGVFATLQQDHRAALFVVGGIEPVSELEVAVGVRFILRFVEEMIDRNREVVSWIECRRVNSSPRDALPLREQRLASCFKLMYRCHRKVCGYEGESRKQKKSTSESHDE